MNRALRVGDGVLYAGPDEEIPKERAGWVMVLEADQALVWWKDTGRLRVALNDLRLAPPRVARSVGQAANQSVWELLGAELPQPASGRPRDPYLEQGCHPDIVVRVWDELGSELPSDCRAQAKGRPVLAHPETDRVFALAHGTAYALWLVDEDFELARESGAKTVMTWSSGTITDLATKAGPGWIWGGWDEREPTWLRHAFAELAAPG